MRKLEKEEIPYIIAIVVTSFGILYNFFPMSASNILILFGIDLLLSMAWKRSLVLSRMERLLKGEKTFIERGELPSLSERIEEAKTSIWMMSESFGQLLGVDFGLIEQKYREGCEVKILMLNPNSIRNRMMTNLDEIGLKNHLEASINFIRKYTRRSKTGGVISGRLLPFEPGFGLFITDGDSSEGKIKVELMLKGTTPYEWPNIIITRKEEERYDQLMKHFNMLWELSGLI